MTRQEAVNNFVYYNDDELDKCTTLRTTKERKMQYRTNQHEIIQLQTELIDARKSINHALSKITAQEILIRQLKDDLKTRDENIHKVHNELDELIESLAVILTSQNKIVEPQEIAIKNCIREILDENKSYTVAIQNLQQKLVESKKCRSELIESTINRIKTLEDERLEFENKLRNHESHLESCELSRASLQRDNNKLMTFLDCLGKNMQISGISENISLEHQIETFLSRAEQLSKLETDKLIDKASIIYQLQRRVRTLREQLQRRDLHLDLLRRKLSLQEDTLRAKSILQDQKNEANLRIKKLMKQIDYLQLQISEEKMHSRELSDQLTEAAEFKLAALERSRKVEELQKRFIESEILNTRYSHKLIMLKDQIHVTNENIDQERSMNSQAIQLLREELSHVKQNLAEITHRESELQSFRLTIIKLLSEPICTPNNEIISKLQKLITVHRDFTMLSRRYDESLDNINSKHTSFHPLNQPGSPILRCMQFDGNGYLQASDL